LGLLQGVGQVQLQMQVLVLVLVLVLVWVLVLLGAARGTLAGLRRLLERPREDHQIAG
jgi:hypothetical protein